MVRRVETGSGTFARIGTAAVLSVSTRGAISGEDVAQFPHPRAGTRSQTRRYMKGAFASDPQMNSLRFSDVWPAAWIASAGRPGCVVPPPGTQSGLLPLSVAVRTMRGHAHHQLISLSPRPEGASRHILAPSLVIDCGNRRTHTPSIAPIDSVSLVATRESEDDMSRTEPAILQLHSAVLDLRDNMIESALADDGVIQDHEQAAIDQVGWIARQLERGNAARLRAQAIENTWSLEDTPRTVRRIRDLMHDFDDAA